MLRLMGSRHFHSWDPVDWSPVDTPEGKSLITVLGCRDTSYAERRLSQDSDKGSSVQLIPKRREGDHKIVLHCRTYLSLSVGC